MEENTVNGITFTTFDGNYETGIFALGGVANNYNLLAQQIKAFEEEEKISRVGASNVKLNKEGAIEFNLQVTFNKELIK